MLAGFSDQFSLRRMLAGFACIKLADTAARPLQGSAALLRTINEAMSYCLDAPEPPAGFHRGVTSSAGDRFAHAVEASR
jgi:hypothetical protein